MALTLYCAFDEVRAALGVNSEELNDAVLSLPIYEIGLVRELNKISTSLPAAFSTCNALGARSDLQQALVDATKLFSAYATARQVGASLAMLAPKDVGDGKATISRWAGTPYQDTMNEVKAQLAAARENLAGVYATYANGDAPDITTPGTFFVAAGRSVDPVTGS